MRFRILKSLEHFQHYGSFCVVFVPLILAIAGKLRIFKTLSIVDSERESDREGSIA